MPNFIYTRDRPDAPNDPSADQAPMKENTNSTHSIIAVDHFGFNDNQGGYHNIIHQPPQDPDDNPDTIAGINQLYVRNVIPDTTGGVADTQLFTRTGLGGISQLTGNYAAVEGYQWVGGILIQWGSVTISTGTGSSTHRTGSVTFKDRGGNQSTIPFPNNCFNVVASFTALNTAQTTASNSLSVLTLTKTSFSWVANSSSSSFVTNFPTFYWVAVGN